MNTFCYADFPALLVLLRHLPDDNFQHESIDERLRRRHGELTKFYPFYPIIEADKGSFAAPTGCRERGARRVAQGAGLEPHGGSGGSRHTRTLARAFVGVSDCLCPRVYACPMPILCRCAGWSHMAALGPDHHVRVLYNSPIIALYVPSLASGRAIA